MMKPISGSLELLQNHGMTFLNSLEVPGLPLLELNGFPIPYKH